MSPFTCVLLLTSIFLFSNSESCLKEAATTLLHCNVLVDDMNVDLEDIAEAPRMDKLEPVQKKCETALECYKSIDCPEIKENLTEVVDKISMTCESLYL